MDMVKTKIKNPERIRKKQEQICRGAMKVFKTKGFHAASIREIASSARMSIGSLYDYIEKKDDILFLLHKDILDKIYQRLNESLRRFDDPADQLVSVLRDLFLLTCQMKDEMLFVYTETKSLEKKYLYEVLRKEAEFVSALESIIKRGIEKGVFECQKSALLANIIIFIGAIIPMRGWNILPQFSEEETLEELIDMIVKKLHVMVPEKTAQNV
jgi:AcrR family transcriptional regulator